MTEKISIYKNKLEAQHFERGPDTTSPFKTTHLKVTTIVYWNIQCKYLENGALSLDLASESRLTHTQLYVNITVFDQNKINTGFAGVIHKIDVVMHLPVRPGYVTHCPLFVNTPLLITRPSITYIHLSIT